MGAQQTEIKPATPRAKNRPWKVRILIPACLIAVVLLAVIGTGMFSIFQEHRLLAKARRFYEEKNYNSAALFVERVLQFKPRSVEANRLMADLSDAVGSSHSLYWRRTTAELDPASLEDHLAWADTALRLHEVAMAGQALASVRSDQRNTGSYYEMEGRVAEALNQPNQAETSFSKALSLEPKNTRFQLDLARLRLHSASPPVRDEAESRIEALAAQPGLFSEATQALIDAALIKGDADGALGLSKKLQGAPDAPFDDRLQYLGLLLKYHRPEFAGYLATLQQDYLANPNRLTSLVHWMNENGLAILAIDWWKQLPQQTRMHMPLPAGIAESYVLLREWEPLKSLVSTGNWGQIEYMRLAMLARVSREGGDELGSQTEWTSAVRAASRTPEALSSLARTAVAWGWDDYAEDLLWKVAQGSYDQQWALQELYLRFFPIHSTRNLLKVVTRMYELDPSDTWTRNNLAAYELLLQSNVPQGVQLARDLYQSAPGNPDYASTYAFALHLLGRSAEGVPILKSLGEERLRQPGYAVYYGALLAAAGDSGQEATKYLDIAETGDLFPEERLLLDQAREQLTYRQVPAGSAPAGK